MCVSPYRSGGDDDVILDANAVAEVVAHPEKYGRPMLDDETVAAIRELQKQCLNPSK